MCRVEQEVKCLVLVTPIHKFQIEIGKIVGKEILRKKKNDLQKKNPLVMLSY